MAKRSSKKRPPRRLPLDRDRVLEAAVALADAGSLDSLSMRKLAQSLGVEAMSLYNHVANKDDILDGIVDRVVAEIEVPEVGGDWKAQMRRRAHSAHAVLVRHRWATMLLVSRINIGPAMLRYVDATVGCLREAGFTWAMADYAWHTIDSHVYGFTLQELNFPFEPEEYAASAEQYMDRIADGHHLYLEGMAREIAAGRHDGLQDFAFGLELVLDGLDRLRLTQARPSRSKTSPSKSSGSKGRKQ